MKRRIRIKPFILISIVVSLIAAACASASAQKSEPTQLSSKQITRIRAADASLESFFTEWGLEKNGPDCLLIFSDREEWLIGCEGVNAPQFSPTGQALRGAPVLWLNQSLYVAGNLMPYEKIKMNLVGTVGTYNLKDGESKPVLILQDWDVLRANHPGFTDSALEEWLAVFVHEAFHARQMWRPEVQKKLTAWSQTPIASPQELMGFYKQNSEFQEYIKNEHRLLTQATDRAELSAAQAKVALRKWMKMYETRRQKFAAPLEAAFPKKKALEMDAFLTFIEGTARYVEARYLLAAQSHGVGLASDPTFKNFVSSRGKKASQLVGLGNIGPKYFYSLGMHLSFLLDKAHPEWKKNVFENDDFLIGEINKAIHQ